MPVINDGGRYGATRPADPQNWTYISLTTAEAIQEIYGSNLVNTARVFLRSMDPDDNDGDTSMGVLITPSTDIHNNTRIECDLAANPGAGNLHVVNPIAYHNQIITHALGDLLYHQAHVGMGLTRQLPNSDISSSAGWTSFPSGPKWQAIAEPTNNWSANTGVKNTTTDAGFRVGLSPLPAWAAATRECVINMMCAVDSTGTDKGIGFEVNIYGVGANLLGSSVIEARGDYNLRFGTCKFPALTENVAAVQIIARDYVPGAGSFRKWMVCALECMAFHDYSSSSTDPLNIEVFNDLAARYASAPHQIILDLDLQDVSFRQAILNIVEHAPDLLLYLDWKSTITLAVIDNYDVALFSYTLSPLAKNIRAVKRRWLYKDKFATRIQISWGVQLPSSYESNSENSPASRGNRHLVMSLNYPDSYKSHVDKSLDRRYVRNYGKYAREIGDIYLALYSKPIEALEIVCEIEACQCEPGDVAVLDFAELGYSNRKFYVVAKEIDDDDETVTLTLFDFQNVPADVAPAFLYEIPAWSGFDAGGMLGVR